MLRCASDCLKILLDRRVSFCQKILCHTLNHAYVGQQVVARVGGHLSVQLGLCFLLQAVSLTCDISNGYHSAQLFVKDELLELQDQKLAFRGALVVIGLLEANRDIRANKVSY